LYQKTKDVLYMRNTT